MPDIISLGMCVSIVEIDHDFRDCEMRKSFNQSLATVLGKSDFANIACDDYSV